jgi:hypothetical protein
MELLSNPIGYFEFRREKREYVSFQFPSGFNTPQNLRQIAQALAKQYVETNTERIDDEDIARRFKRLTTDRLGGIMEEVGRHDPALPKRAELIQLCAALASHLFRRRHAIARGADTPPATESASILNASARASLASCCRELEAFSCADTDSAAGKEAPNCYPYVAIELLDCLPGTMFVCVVTALDGWFVDERTKDDRRLPGIALAAYDISESPYQLASDRAALQDALCARIGATDSQIMAYRRGQALDRAAGEASSIGRYWFGEGVSKLLETSADAGGLESEDVLSFWSRFVKELLCARIESIRTTESFHSIVH